MIARVLLVAAVLCAYVAAALKCKLDSDCTKNQYCKEKIECIPLLTHGDACIRDTQCISKNCGQVGKCLKEGKPLAPGIIAGIAGGAVVVVLLLGVCLFCFIKRKRNAKAEIVDA